MSRETPDTRARTYGDAQQLPGCLGLFSRLNRADFGALCSLILLFVGWKIMNARHRAQYSPLQWAAAQGETDQVKRLIRQGANVDEPSKDRQQTALHLAASCGHPEIVKILIENGANVNARDQDAWTPLHLAAGKEDKPPLDPAIEALRVHVARLLLENGAKVNAGGGGVNETPLHEAASCNSAPLVEVLLKHGADPNRKQSQGMTPLHLALFAGQDRAAVVRLLLKHGADPNLPDGRGETALAQARRLHPELVGLLEKAARKKHRRHD